MTTQTPLAIEGPNGRFSSRLLAFAPAFALALALALVALIGMVFAAALASLLALALDATAGLAETTKPAADNEAAASSGVTTGVATAAHCPRTLYRGKAKPPNRLPFRGRRFGGSGDAQWHATPKSADGARVRLGRGYRSVPASTPSAYQPVGAYGCKFGARTGRTCGTISGKWYAPGYVPRANATFVGVASERPVVGAGESGGPFLSGAAAYGTTVAYSRSGSTHYGYYMPVDYLNSLGVRVITR